MPRIENVKIQATNQKVNDLIRELNRRMDTIKEAVNLNFLRSVPQVDAWVDQNADVTVWLPLYDFEIDSWSVYVDDVTTPPTINMRVDGANEDTQTPTVVQVYEYELTSVASAPSGSRVSLNVTNLTPGATVSVAIGIRRLN